MTAELTDIFRDAEALRTWHDVSLVIAGAAVNLIGGAVVATATVLYDRYRKWEFERRHEQPRSIRGGLHRV